MSSSSATSIDEEQIVATFDTVLEAEMARGRLEVEGIASRIVDGNVVGIAQHLSMAVGGAKLVVHESDLAAARTILFSPSALVDEDFPVNAPDAADGLVPSEQGIAHNPISADDLALRALRASVIGLVFFPPLGQLYSLWLLKRLDATALTDVGRRRRSISLAIDGAVLAGGFFVGALLFR
jgi:hypothetical protein